MSDSLISTNANTTTSQSSAWADWAGLVASIGCAIHCAAMPFVIAYLPALGLSFLADEDFHKWMAAGCFAIALAAFVPGLRKHGRLTPVIVGSVGLMFITTAAFGFAGECCPACEAAANPVASSSTAGCTDANCEFCTGESLAEVDSTEVTLTGQSAPQVPPSAWIDRVVPWLTPLGGLVLVSAHLLNRRYGCLCGCCESASSDEVDR